MSPVVVSLALASSSQEKVSRVEDLRENISVFWHWVVSITSLQNLEQASVLVQRAILSCWVPMNVFIPLRAVSNSFSSAPNASNSSLMAADTLAEVLLDRGVVSFGVSWKSEQGLGPLLLGVEPLENGERSLPSLAKGGVGSLAGLPNG